MARFRIPEVDGQVLRRGVADVPTGDDAFGNDIQRPVRAVDPTADTFGAEAARADAAVGMQISQTAMQVGRAYEQGQERRRREEEAKKARRDALTKAEEKAQRDAEREQYAYQLKTLRRDLAVQARENNWSTKQYEDTFKLNAERLRDSINPEMSEHSRRLLQHQLTADGFAATSSFLDDDLTDYALHSRRQFASQQDSTFVANMANADYNEARLTVERVVASRMTPESMALHTKEERFAQSQTIIDEGWLANIKAESTTNPDRVLARLNDPKMYVGMSDHARKRAKDHLGILYQLDEQRQKNLRKQRQEDTAMELTRQAMLGNDISAQLDDAADKRLITLGEYRTIQKLQQDVIEDGTIVENGDVVIALDSKAVSGDLTREEVIVAWNRGQLKRSTATRLLGETKKAKADGNPKLFSDERVKMEIERLKGQFAANPGVASFTNQKRTQAMRIYEFKQRVVAGEDPTAVANDIIKLYGKGYKPKDLPKVRFASESEVYTAVDRGEITKAEAIEELDRLKLYQQHDVVPRTKSEYTPGK